MSLISLQNVTLEVGGSRLLDKVSWTIETNKRIALVGRNGAGKSSLLKLIQGDLVADQGHLHRQSGLNTAGLTQNVPIAADENVYHFLVKSLGDLGELMAEFYELSTQDISDRFLVCQQKMDDWQAWEYLPQVETMASRLGIDPSQKMSELSGGMKRRVLLAAALIAKPDLLLLDEPTNHLDLNAIEWLESYLKSYPGSLLVVTHDREFLNQVANSIVEIDRGKLYFYDCNFATYLERRDSLLLAEQRQNDLFDKRLAQEEVWVRTGIKARRTRNEGRVRALKAMREEYRARRVSVGQVKSRDLEAKRSGELVLEASDISYKSIIKNFSWVLLRKAKVGIIGPNGCGKTTLIRLLLGELQPDSGTLRCGTSLEVAYFDQLRGQLDEQQTVMANVADGADHVTINGQQKHVATYLKEFLFPSERFNQQVSTLSGGERNRLLLAKLFAKPVNLLVLDEPTNDLDMETLELLETILMDYSGTLLLISHDRAFINQVVTSVLVFENEGEINEYVGGYSDYQVQKNAQKQQPAKSPIQKVKTHSEKLGYNEQKELSQLPQKIDLLENKISQIHLEMAKPDFYQQSEDTIGTFTKQLSKEEAELEKLYARWQILEDKQ